MKTKKRDDVYKIHRAKPGSKLAKIMASDPAFIKKGEACVKSLTENPPPEWIVRRMRGED